MEIKNSVVEVNLVQGSDEWIKYRRGCFNASELGVAMGIDKNVIRRDLQRVYATGTEIEYSRFVKEVVFAGGHEAEEKIRPLVAADFDTEFNPKVFMLEGLTAIPLSVSLDGLCAFGDYNLEIKQFNQELFESVKNGIVPDDRMPQLQQQLMLSPANKTIFAVSNETMDGYVYTIVDPDPDFIADIPMIWQGFWDGVQNFTEFETFDLVPKSASEVTTPEFAINGGSLSIRSNIGAWNNGILSRHNALPVNVEADTFPLFKETKDILDAGAKLLKIRIKELEKQAEPMLELLKQYKEIQRDLSSKASGLEGKMSDFRREQRMIRVNKAALDYVDLSAKLISEIPHEFYFFKQPCTPDFYAACSRCKNHESVASAVEAALDAAKIELMNWFNNVISKNKLIESLQDKYFRIDFAWSESFATFSDDQLTAEFNRQKQAKIDAIELQKLRRKQAEEAAKAAEIVQEVAIEQAQKKELTPEPTPTPAALRETADKIAQPAEYADRAEDRNRELARAAELKRQADELEAVQNVKPNRNDLITVIADDYRVSYDIAEKWLIAEFGGK